MRCRACGQPANAELCVNCAQWMNQGAQSRPPADATQVHQQFPPQQQPPPPMPRYQGSPQPDQTVYAPQHQQYQSPQAGGAGGWVTPEEAQRRQAEDGQRDSRMVALGFGAVLVLALLAGLVWFLVLDRGEGDTAAEPAPAPTETTSIAPSPSELPVETEPGPEAVPEPAVVTITVTAEPEPEPTPEPAPATVYITVTAEPTPPPPPPADGGAISAEEAVAAVDRYLNTAPGNPSAGWELMTYRRQAVENRDSYYEFWGSVSAASASGCSFDTALHVVDCTLKTTTNGRTGTTETRWWLTREDGVVKIDLAGGVNDGHVDAEDQLERYRNESLSRLHLDERWALVLSAKRPGITDSMQVAANGTHTFYFPDILAEHEALRDRLWDTDVLMLRRADYGKQGGADLWFTIADPGGLHSEADAKAWCASAFPELSGRELENQCLPTRLRAPYGP